MDDVQFLRWKMEQVWLTRGCVCPSHLVRWSTEGKGYRFYNADMTDTLLWYMKGRNLGPRKGRVKGKGFSFIAWNYGLYWRIQVK